MIYTKELKEKKETKSYLPLFVLIYLGFVATTYLVVEGDQVWRVGSSPFSIYTKNKRANYTNKRMVVHHHRPSRALAMVKQSRG